MLITGNVRPSRGYKHDVFIDNKYIPVNRVRDVTYGRVGVEYCTEKSDPYRT